MLVLVLLDSDIPRGGSTMADLSDILDFKGRAVHTTSPDATVLDAVEEMCRLHVGALVVVVPMRVPVGIVSERDVMTRVVLSQRDPAKTKVCEAMTSAVVCISPDATVEDAMQLMTDRRCRHLPVVVDGRVEGLVSIGDLVRSVSREEESEIRMLHEYVSGRYPG
jgi:CBS domain-containing protein